jgi:hypothetical protein
MQEDNDFSTNRASAVHQLSTVRENEAPKAPPAAQFFGGAPQRNFSGGGHTTKKPDDESYPAIWLRAMGVNEGAASFGHMRRLLDAIGVSDIEELVALATSFDDRTDDWKPTQSGHIDEAAKCLVAFHGLALYNET